MTTHAPGRKFLKVTGILYIIFASLYLLLLFYTVTTIGSNVRAGLVSFLLFLAFYTLFVGIVGVYLCNNIEQAGFLTGVIVFGLFLNFIYFLINPFGINIFVSLLFELPLPILYLVGARKNAALFHATTTGTNTNIASEDNHAPVNTNANIAPQDNGTTTETAPQEKAITNIDAAQLRELKSLLDEGVITAEEFDAKKKQVLGI